MIIYTDGACSGNGSATAIGGFGVVILDDDKNPVGFYNKQNQNTTNNREELRAILWALIKYGREETPPIVYSDSAYAVNTFNTWMFGWAAKGWVKSDNKTPENLDLIEAYYKLWQSGGYRIDLRKCRGHAGDKWNEMADKLAVAAKEGRGVGELATQIVMEKVTIPVMKFNQPNKNNTIVNEGAFNV